MGTSQAGLFGIHIPILDDIIGYVSDIFTWITNVHVGFTNLFGHIIGFFAKLIYVIQTGFFWFIDIIQGIFRKVAGLDVYYQGGVEQSGDIVYSLLTHPVIIGVLISVTVVAVILLFMATIVAIIRSEWAVQGANPKGKIWGQALKSLFFFVMVPVVCILGVFVSNAVLKSIDGATRVGGNDSLSGST